jgi:hypothetical protein
MRTLIDEHVYEDAQARELDGKRVSQRVTEKLAFVFIGPQHRDLYAAPARDTYGRPYYSTGNKKCPQCASALGRI